MRHKDPDNASKRKILMESFKLFTVKSISDITFSDLEEATGLSRGAILYHFKSKDQIFAEVVDQFITAKGKAPLLVNEDKSLWESIENFIDTKRQQQDYFTSIGIPNINRAFIYMAANAMVFSKEIPERIQLRREKELEYWKKTLLIATKRGEIKNGLDLQLEAQILLDIHYGYSYTCMASSNGYDLDYLLKQFRSQYTKLTGE